MTESEDQVYGVEFPEKDIQNATKLASTLRELYLDDSPDASKGLDPFGKLVSEDPDTVITPEEAESGLKFIFGVKKKYSIH